MYHLIYSSESIYAWVRFVCTGSEIFLLAHQYENHVLAHCLKIGSRNRKTMGFPAEKNDGMVGDTTGFDLGASISLVASSARPVATRPANRAAFRAPLPPNLKLNKH